MFIYIINIILQLLLVNIRGYMYCIYNYLLVNLGYIIAFSRIY